MTNIILSYTILPEKKKDFYFPKTFGNSGSRFACHQIKDFDLK